MSELLLDALLINSILYLVTWAIGTRLKNISIIDGIWSLSFALTLTVCLGHRETLGVAEIMLAFAIYTWAVRLAVHLLPRSLSHGEDHRYTRMRQGWSTAGFVGWSLFAIFGLQLVLSLILSLPFIAVFSSQAEPDTLVTVGFAVAIIGFVYECIADAQLKIFRATQSGAKGVLNTGLWRYSRHPNYFGEWLFWWGIWLVAIGFGVSPWTVLSPLLLTVLLFQVSGVKNMESTIKERRPDYARYVQTTNAFFPGRPGRSHAAKG